MMHPDSICKEVNEIVGLGVFATKDIPKGGVIWAYDGLDLEIEKDRYEKLPSLCRLYVDKYSYMSGGGTYTINWDHSKYMNHCCSANTLCTAYSFCIAICDIKKGEQMTCDYRMLDDSGPEMPLMCNQEKCLKRLSYEGSNQLVKFWDAKIRDALNDFAKVSQPLLSIIDASDIEDVHNFLKNNETYKSVASLHANLSL